MITQFWLYPNEMHVPAYWIFIVIHLQIKMLIHDTQAQNKIRLAWYDEASFCCVPLPLLFMELQAVLDRFNLNR